MEDKKTIECIIDMFSIEQKIYYPTGEVFKVSIDNLPEWTVASCYNKGYDTIHLIGPKDFVLGLADKILYHESSNYSNTRIKIEVN